MTPAHIAASLTPCPFCGSRNVGQWKIASCVVCHNCGAEGPCLDAKSAADLKDPIAAWNTRTPAPDVSGLVEALRGLENAFWHFVNCWKDPYEPVADYDAETARNVKELGAEVTRARAALAKWEGRA